MATLITSQDFLDDATVDAKVAAEDFAVLVSPEFSVDGRSFRLVLDGHHSLAAAIQAGADADITEATTRDHDAVALLLAGDVEGFLEATHMGADLTDAVTGAPAF